MKGTRGVSHMSAASPGTSRPLRSWPRRLLSILKAPYNRLARRYTIRRSAKGSIDTARTWRRRRSGVTILEILSYLGAAALGVVVVWSFIVMLRGPGVLKSLNDRCDSYSAACGTAVGFLIPLLSVATASAIFLFYRLRHVTSPLVKEAKDSPQGLVETATPSTRNIVGRDELCQVIMEDIRHRDFRRPHLLVGGVGTGKTAVLVLLTKLLAEHSAIPVPIRLRDAKDGLNFREMAYNRFLHMTEGRLLSTGEAEKVWRQLCKDDKVVVIADGLEEALVEGSANQDRDNLIRFAIHRARELNLPLIIASRPHDPLRGADATIMELEPLSEEAALEYIIEGNDTVDARWLDWVVETAGLTELPLYLQITRQLCQHDRLDYLAADRSAKKVDMRGLDRSELRLHLLDTWMDALFDGHLMPAVPLSKAERKAAVEWLSALACLGLKADTVDVKFEDYYQGGQDNELEVSQWAKYREIDRAIRLSLNKKLPRRHLDIRLAATWGDQLQLVQAYGDGLRFRHSIMQAYLGSRFMSTALKDSKFREEAAKKLQKPGREFLIALVLYSRSPDADRRPAGQPQAVSAGPSSAATAGPGASGETREGREASGSTTADASTAATAATGTAVAATAPLAAATALGPVPARIPADGQTAASADPSTGAAPGAKPSALRSDVESIRDALTESAADATDDVKKLDLYAAALEIDSFLEQSCHQRISESIANRWGDIRGGDQRTLDEAKLGLVYRFGDAVRAIAGRPDRGMTPLDPAYDQLLKMGCGELSYPIRLAIAQEIGAGGDEAFRVLHTQSADAAISVWAKTAWPDAGTEPGKKPSEHEHHETRKKPGQDDQAGNAAKDSTLRGRTLCAWLTPLLVGSVDDYREEARDELGQWLDHVGHETGGKDDFHVSLEVALAQGFKYAANRRLHHPHALPETRSYLAEQAMEMLKKARFWFSQLTLIHALCLWEMPDPGGPRNDPAGVRSNGERPAKYRHGSNPEAIVGRWLEVAGNSGHPFVDEAGRLAVQALKTGHPERFLWIDESGVVSSVGSCTAQATNYRKHHLWIPPSTGWVALDPRAQQLVADVLILLNLAERGEGPNEIEQRLRRVGRSDLPPCLTQDRRPLEPGRTVGGLYTAPGSNCMAGCRFDLCPYPPNGVQPYRSELSETFCRGQQTLLSRGLTAPWQTMLRADLRHFWEQMANRARSGSADEDRD